MNKEQFEDIEKKLAKWREERSLSVEEQKRNFKVNYTKELLEFFEAERDDNEYEMIDALCDMIVVAINSEGTLPEKRYWNDSKQSKHRTTQRVTGIFKWSEICIDNLVRELELRGYDPYLCLLETIKELNTRTGKWNEKEGKWCKDFGAYTLEEAQRKIYEMDNGVREVMWAVLEEENETHFVFEVDFGTNIQKIKVKRWYKADYEKCKIVEN